MSESPEEQPSTGVLGRIGSWFSPWRGKGQSSPTENDSTSIDETLKSEEEDIVREQQWEEEEKEQSSNPDPLGFSRDIFPCEEKDATQSAHRDGSVVSSTERPEGGPREEEFVESRKERIGQGKGREESSNGTSESGNPEKNASHLTHHSSFSEQGVVWDSDQAHTPPQAQRETQAQTGKRLHVYLEETSVFQCGKDTRAGQEVVRTKVTKSLKVLPKTKSSQSFDSLESSTSSAENKRTNARPAVGTDSYYSALVGVSLKSRKHSQLEPVPEQTDADNMGRKNAARKKVRKNSQGDGGNSPQEKIPAANAEPLPEGYPTSDNSVTSPEGKSPKTQMGESTVNSSSKCNPTSQASSEGEIKTSCSAKQWDNYQDSSSVTATTLASVVDGNADMEDDDSLYKVERKTETPESKRRSIKVSRSEVKLFTKNVPLNPKQSPERDARDFKSALKETKGETRDTPKTKTDARLHDLKKIDEEPKPVAVRIKDKINLFERPARVADKKTFQAPRSADVSPVRNATERLKADFVLSEQRSRSAERYDAAKSSSSLTRERPIPIKDRVRNFTEAFTRDERSALPPKPAMKGMSQKSMSSVAVVASKSPELDNQGKRDTDEQTQTNASFKITRKPEGRDTTDVAGKISIPKEQPTDCKTKEALESRTADQGTKPDNAETKVPAKRTDDSAEVINNNSQQSKGPSRAGSRSKRRKNKEPTSPISPNSENKPDCSTSKPALAAVKQEQVHDRKGNPSKQLTEKVSLQSNKAQGNKSKEQCVPDTKQQTFLKHDPDKQKKQSDSFLKKENIDKPCNSQESEPSVIKDKPDPAACSNGTKTPIDKDPVIFPQKEEKAGRDGLLFAQGESEKASKDSRETPASINSAVLEQPIEKTPSDQEPPVKGHKLDKELSIIQFEPRSTGELKESNKKDSEKTQQPQHKDTELINDTESKEVNKLEKVECEKINQPDKKSKETSQQLLQSDKNTTTVKVSGTGTRGCVAMDDERQNAERKEKTWPVEDERKPEASQPERATESSEKTPLDLPAQTQQVKETTTTTHIHKAAVCSVAQANEAVSGTKSDKELSKGGETSTNVPTELQAESTESPETKTESVIAAEPQPGSVYVENTPDDSCTHGADDGELSSTRPITKATIAVKEMTLKAANDTQAPIIAQCDTVAEKELSVKDSASISVSKSVSSKVAGQDDGKESSAVESEVKISGDVVKLTPRLPQRDVSKNTESANDITSLEGAGKIAQQSGDSAAFSTTVNVEKTAEKTSHSPKNELSPVANGDISSHPQPRTITKEPLDNKPSRTPKAPASPEVNKLIPDTIQRSSMKKFHLPRGLSKDDSARQDTPSSWLDLDFPKRKPKAPVPKLSSAGSESNLLDTSGDLDDEDFVEKIKKLCAPFSLPPRKHNILRPPQPPFAMPAIKEDRLEKTFDPEEFKFGLRKQKFTVDTTPSMLAKLQHPETKKSGIKPARASLADRSILLSSLDVHSRLAREKPLVKDEDDVKEEKDEQIKVKSRLEGSCVFSNLNSSIRGKRNQTENTNSGEVSPSESPQPSPSPSSQPPPPSPTATAPIKDALSKQSSATRNREETQAAEAVVSDSGLPFPSFNDIKLPDYLEKYLPSREPAKPEQSTQGQEVVKTEFMPQVIGKMSTPASRDEPDRAVKPGRVLPDAAPPSFPGNLSTTHPPLPELKQPLAKPQKKLTKKIRTAKGFHKRPGKMVLFEKAQFSGQPYEIYRDVADATSLQLSHLISVMVVRGCWVLYEKPDFQGRTIALEEGGIELTNMWAEPGQETEPRSDPPMIIGSIRLAVWDYSIPHIDLFTEPEGLGRVTPYHDDTIETGSFGIPLSTASIQVHSGVWLVFSDPGFQGMLAVLETGVYPFPEAWGFPSPFIGSLRPLKIGGFKVENPTEVKAVVYEKPGFEGSCLEIDSDVFCFGEGDEGIAADEANLDSKKLNSVGSLKIVGGFWVGYSEPGFEGQQHILEEGEYLDCSDWGSSEPLLSLRPVLADFLSPHLKMFSDRDFGERGVNIDITVPVINMDDTGYGLKTQSIDVIGGVWVVFEEPGFCGEPYILEKGLYGNPEDWGALQPRVASAMPVVLFDFESADKFKVQLFSEPGFQGSVQTLGDSRASLQDGFTVGSCKVLAGSWLAFEGRDFAGRMYVLEVGSYSDLRAMGCFHAGSSILSLQTAGFEFSLPSITLFERGGLRGKRVILTDGSVNLQLAGGCSRVQSVLVEGGMWVLYEGINYRGAQILLKPGEVPDWRRFSSWLKIGSLRPLIQKQVHFRLRNRQSGLMMTVTGDLDDVKLMRIQETEETDGIDQIWSYRNGHLHCKLLEECCMGPSGSVTIAGSRVGLTPETSHHLHLWSITPEGFIRYTPTSDLVLEVKGGHHYDKNQVILNTFDPNKPQQRWNVEVI